MSLRAASAGVDTWAPAWRVRVDTPLSRHLEEVATLPSAAGGKLVPQKIAGHRVIYWPGSGLLKAEGHPNESGLAPVRSLPRALDQLVEQLHAAGIPAPHQPRRFDRHNESEGFEGLRRLDLTVDLRADDRHEGRAVLHAVEAAARASGHHAPTYGRRGKPGRTVYISGESGVFGRWYDKGAESGKAAPYRLIRPEAQWNFRQEKSRPAWEDIGDVELMRQRFAKRWGPWMRGRIVVGTMTDLGEELARAVRERRLSPTEARRIAGYLVMEPYGLDGVPLRTQQRLRSEAGRFGFHLVDGVLEPLDVDLGEVLHEAERAELWDAGVVNHTEPPDPSVELRRDMARRLSEKRPNARKPPGEEASGGPLV